MRILAASCAMLVAALATAPQSFAAEARAKGVCQEAASGTRECVYDTFEQCRKVLGHASGKKCITNPAWLGTTGEGGKSRGRSSRSRED